jgi:hypothetical protein
MFESIKQSLKESKNKDGGLYLRFEPVNTFLVRLLPNLKNPANTTLNYYFHMFNSHKDGSSVNFTCPTTYKERCTACSLRFKLYRNGGEIDKKLSQELSRKSKFLVNAYVISDPLNPQNNGKVKVIRYGTQLAKIINDAIDGDDAAEFGQSIFDLSENGCNLRIKVENAGDWPSYVTSKFLSKSKIEGMTEERMEEIYNSTNDLEALITSTDPVKIDQAIKEHFLLENKDSSIKNESINKPKEENEKEENDKEDNLNMKMEEPKENKVDEKEQVESPADVQKKIDDLLEGI